MAPGTGLLQKVKKSQDTNVYMYIGRPLGGPLVGASIGRMEASLSRFFYENERALERALASLSLSFVGGNVGRAFWAIGKGAISPTPSTPF